MLQNVWRCNKKLAGGGGHDFLVAGTTPWFHDKVIARRNLNMQRVRRSAKKKEKKRKGKEEKRKKEKRAGMGWVDRRGKERCVYYAPLNLLHYDTAIPWRENFISLRNSLHKTVGDIRAGAATWNGAIHIKNTRTERQNWWTSGSCNYYYKSSRPPDANPPSPGKLVLSTRSWRFIIYKITSVQRVCACVYMCVCTFAQRQRGWFVGWISSIEMFNIKASRNRVKRGSRSSKIVSPFPARVKFKKGKTN